jgi:hypothetical protein
MPVKRKPAKTAAYFSAGLDIEPEDFTRINNDVNGNGRYVIHFLRLLSNDEKYSTPMTIDQKYNLALRKAKKAGGKKFHNKMYGGGIVFTTSSLPVLINILNSI